MLEQQDITGLEGFTQYVANLLPMLKRQYDRNINRDLSQQMPQGLLQRNVTTVLKEAYQASLVQLQDQIFETEFQLDGAAPSSLTLQVLKAFDGLIDEVVAYALQKHRTSCALSNFPEEHKPSQDYLTQVLLLTHHDWLAFVLEIKHLFDQQYTRAV